MQNKASRAIRETESIKILVGGLFPAVVIFGFPQISLIPQIQ
jgi:hypothetical protein